MSAMPNVDYFCCLQQLVLLPFFYFLRVSHKRQSGIYAETEILNECIPSSTLESSAWKVRNFTPRLLYNFFLWIF
jgi:hypothetical protein